jgi:hypothetical protein
MAVAREPVEGDHGRLRVKAGDVIFHEQFEAHLDRFSENGCSATQSAASSRSFLYARNSDGGRSRLYCARPPREVAETP